MLSIRTIRADEANTFLHRESGAPDLGPEQRRWLGDGLAAVGLDPTSPEPDAASIERLPLLPNPRLGYDLTFSAPMSVSIAFAEGKPSERQRIQDAHRAAIDNAIRHIQANCYRETTGLVAFAVDHDRSSHRGNPQLHTHILAFNIAQVLGSNVWRPLPARDLFESKTAAAEVYRADLAALLGR